MLDTFSYEFNWPFLHGDKCYDISTAVDGNILTVTIMHQGKVVDVVEREFTACDDSIFVKVAFEMTEEALAASEESLVALAA